MNIERLLSALLLIGIIPTAACTPAPGHDTLGCRLDSPPGTCNTDMGPPRPMAPIPPKEECCEDRQPGWFATSRKLDTSCKEGGRCTDVSAASFPALAQEQMCIGYPPALPVGWAIVQYVPRSGSSCDDGSGAAFPEYIIENIALPAAGTLQICNYPYDPNTLAGWSVNGTQHTAACTDVTGIDNSQNTLVISR